MAGDGNTERGTRLGRAGERARRHNRRYVFDLIQRRQAANRAELTRATAMSPQTVSNIIVELQAARLIEPVGRLYGGIGQPPVAYRANPAAGAAIGIHLDRGHLRGVRVDAALNVLAETERPLDARSTAMVHREVHALALDLARPNGSAGVPIWGLGIAAPRLVDARVTDRNALEGRLWAELYASGFDARLSAELALPVIVENDANAGALAEMAFGAEPDLSRFCYVFIGRGLGCGMIERGQLIRGGWRNAGEIGRVPLPDAGGEAIERVLSVDGLLTRLGVSGGRRLVPLLASLGGRHGPAIGDWLAQATPLLRWVVALLENMLDPERIVIGSYLPQALLSRLIAGTDPLRHSISAREGRLTSRLVPGARGHAAVALGAAMAPLLAALDAAPDENWAIQGPLPDVYAPVADATAALPNSNRQN